MGKVLAGGVIAIVAVDAVVDEVDMTEVCWQPAGGRMTIITVITSGDMRRVLAGHDYSIMAGTTSTQYL